MNNKVEKLVDLFFSSDKNRKDIFIRKINIKKEVVSTS